jgi:hypothetical protein
MMDVDPSVDIAARNTQSVTNDQLSECNFIVSWDNEKSVLWRKEDFVRSVPSAGVAVLLDPLCREVSSYEGPGKHSLIFGLCRLSEIVEEDPDYYIELFAVTHLLKELVENSLEQSCFRSPYRQAITISIAGRDTTSIA